MKVKSASSRVRRAVYVERQDFTRVLASTLVQGIRPKSSHIFEWCRRTPKFRGLQGSYWLSQSRKPTKLPFPILHPLPSTPRNVAAIRGDQPIFPCNTKTLHHNLSRYRGIRHVWDLRGQDESIRSQPANYESLLLRSLTNA